MSEQDQTPTPISQPSILLIGGSAGAITPLKEILSHLPTSKTFTVIVVLHLLGRQKKSLLTEILQSVCHWPVKDAESTELIQKGVVYAAPADYHLSIEADHSFALSNEEPVKFSRPSIDLLFKSAASVYKTELVGLMLSGANDDGASGVQSILRHGGAAYAQALATAEFKEMPAAAFRVSSDVKPLEPVHTPEFLRGRF